MRHRLTESAVEPRAWTGVAVAVAVVVVAPRTTLAIASDALAVLPIARPKRAPPGTPFDAPRLDAPRLDALLLPESDEPAAYRTCSTALRSRAPSSLSSASLSSSSSSARSNGPRCWCSSARPSGRDPRYIIGTRYQPGCDGAAGGDDDC